MHVKNVLLALADEAFSSRPMPKYDQFNDLVTAVLASSFPGKKCFSWTHSDPDKQKIAASMARLNVDISDLQIPKKFAAYFHFPYPTINEKRFYKAAEGSFGCEAPCKQM